MTDTELFAQLVGQYAAAYRPPDQPPLVIQQHDDTSIRDGATYPEVWLPGVYALYDHDGTLFYVGVSERPSDRAATHRGTARYHGARPAPRIDLVTVTEDRHRKFLEAFLQFMIPDYQGRWDAWKQREQALVAAKAAAAP
jgi:hypothetical protein